MSVGRAVLPTLLLAACLHLSHGRLGASQEGRFRTSQEDRLSASQENRLRTSQEDRLAGSPGRLSRLAGFGGPTLTGFGGPALTGFRGPALSGFSGAALTKRSPNHYCGKELTDILTMLCMGAGKRSSAELETFDPDDDYSREMLLSSMRHPYATSRRLMLQSRRRKRGIVDECCLRPCSLSTIREYCNL